MPRGSWIGRSVAANTTPDVPSERAIDARVHDPDADRVRGLVAATGDHGRPDTQTRRRGRRRAHRARHLGTLVRPRHPRRVDAERREHLRRPVPRGEVEEQRAGAVGLVERVLTGQSQADVVLGEQDVRDAAPDVRLVVAHPHELRRREAGQRVVAGDLDESLGPDGLADRVARRGGPLVVPQDGRAQDVVGRVEEHGAVHLAGQADRDDVVARDARRGQDRPDRRDGAVPPEVRRLLAPERSRDLEPVLGDTDAADRPGIVDQDGLGRGGRGVDPDDVGHRCQRPAPAFARDGSVAQIERLTRFSSRSWPPDTRRGSISPAATLASSDSSDSVPPEIALPSGPSQPA